MGQGEGDPRCTTTAGTAPSSRTRGPASCGASCAARSEEHTSELQSQSNLVCRLLLEKKHIAYVVASAPLAPALCEETCPLAVSLFAFGFAHELLAADDGFAPLRSRHARTRQASLEVR